MKRLTCIAIAALSAAPVVFCAASAHAATIYSDNFSGVASGGMSNTSQATFTSPQVDFTQDSAPILSNFGVYPYAGSGVGVTKSTQSDSPNGLYYNNSASATMGTESDTLYHDAGSLAPNTQYVLEADAVRRETSPPGTLTIELYSGTDDTLGDDTLLNSTSINESTVSVGTYTDITTTFTTGSSVTGDIIARLEFSNPSPSAQTWVGDVKLAATGVPEPATGALLLLGLPLALRRKRAAV